MQQQVPRYHPRGLSVSGKASNWPRLLTGCHLTAGDDVATYEMDVTDGPTDKGNSSALLRLDFIRAHMKRSWKWSSECGYIVREWQLPQRESCLRSWGEKTSERSSFRWNSPPWVSGLDQPGTIHVRRILPTRLFVEDRRAVPWHAVGQFLCSLKEMPVNRGALQAQALRINSRASYSRSPPDLTGISRSSYGVIPSIGGSGTSFKGSPYVFVRWSSSYPRGIWSRPLLVALKSFSAKPYGFL